MPLSKAPLYTAGQLRERVAELAAAIDKPLRGEDVVALIVLKGGLHFGSDLIRRLDLPLEVDFVQAQSYDGTASRGRAEILLRPSLNLKGRHVLLIEDILDTGITANAILNYVRGKAPGAISLCTMFDKPAHRRTDVSADFVGFTVEDRFLVGYGMDYEEQYRELPDVYVWD